MLSSSHPDISFFCSDFANIFDVDWFISYLAKDVPIVKRVPEKVMRSMDKPPYTMRVPRKSEPDYYLEQVLPILLRRRVSKKNLMQQSVIDLETIHSLCMCWLHCKFWP